MNDIDTSARLVRPYPVDADIHRRERSWTLIAGSKRLSFTRTEYQTRPYPHRVIGHGARDMAYGRPSLTGMVAVVLGSVAGLATLGLALHATRAAPVAPYRLSVAIPKAQGTGVAVRRRAIAAAARPVDVDRTAAVADASPAPVAMIEPPTYADAEPAPMTAMKPAIGAALRTGTLQQWASADGAEHGFVVAGPADHGCRTLSILTRRDGNNAVQSRRECATVEEPETLAADTTLP